MQCFQLRVVHPTSASNFPDSMSRPFALYAPKGRVQLNCWTRPETASSQVVCNQSRKSNLCGDVFIMCVSLSGTAPSGVRACRLLQLPTHSPFIISPCVEQQIGRWPERAEICIVKLTSSPTLPAVPYFHGTLQSGGQKTIFASSNRGAESF